MGIISLIPTSSNSGWFALRISGGRAEGVVSRTDLWAKAPFPFPAEGEGEVFLMRSQAVWLEEARRVRLEGGNLSIELESGIVRLNRLEPARVAQEIAGDFVASVEIPREEFSRLLKAADFASREDYRAIMRGVLWDLNMGLLRTVGSDGYALYWGDTSVAGAEEQRVQVVVPSWALEDAERILRGKEPIRVSFAENGLLLQQGGATAFVYAMEGPYPEWQRVVPSTFNVELKVRRKEALAILRMASRIANSVRLFRDVQWRLEALGEYASGAWPWPAAGEGEGDWAFNAKQFVRALEALDGDEVVHRLGSDARDRSLLTAGSGHVILVPLLR